MSHLGYLMHRDVPTLPGELEQAGYRIGRLGKLHVEGDSIDLPEIAPIDRKNIHAVAAAAAAFLAGDDDAPFFLYVALTDAHRPFQASRAGEPSNPVEPGDVPPFPEHEGLDGEAIRQDRAGYYNGVQRVDAAVGKLLRHLDASGRAGRTLVVFTADHGPAFARGKLSVYELGLRVPLIVAGHNVAGGRVDESLTSTVDLMPSILGAAELGVGLSSHGRDLHEVWSGEAAGEGRRYLFGEFLSHGAEKFAPLRSVRDERFKLIVNLPPDRPHPTLNIDGSAVGARLEEMAAAGEFVPAPLVPLVKVPPFELYDLQADPHELRNLADRVAEDAELREAYDRLSAALAAWQRDTADPVRSPAWVARMSRYHDEHGRDGRIDMRPSVRDHADLGPAAARSSAAVQ